MIKIGTRRPTRRISLPSRLRPQSAPSRARLRRRAARRLDLSPVYQTEKFVKDNDEKLPADVKDRVNAALGEVQEALKGTNTDAIKAAMEKLATESQKMGSVLYQQQPTAEGGPTADAGGSQSQQADDEIADKKPAT